MTTNNPSDSSFNFEDMLKQRGLDALSLGQGTVDDSASLEPLFPETVAEEPVTSDSQAQDNENSGATQEFNWSQSEPPAPSNPPHTSEHNGPAPWENTHGVTPSEDASPHSLTTDQQPTNTTSLSAENSHQNVDSPQSYDTPRDSGTTTIPEEYSAPTPPSVEEFNDDKPISQDTIPDNHQAPQGGEVAPISEQATTSPIPQGFENYDSPQHGFASNDTADIAKDPTPLDVPPTEKLSQVNTQQSLADQQNFVDLSGPTDGNTQQFGHDAPAHDEFSAHDEQANYPPLTYPGQAPQPGGYPDQVPQQGYPAQAPQPGGYPAQAPQQQSYPGQAPQQQGYGYDGGGYDEFSNYASNPGQGIDKKYFIAAGVLAIFAIVGFVLWVLPGTLRPVQLADNSANEEVKKVVSEQYGLQNVSDVSCHTEGVPVLSDRVFNCEIKSGDTNYKVQAKFIDNYGKFELQRPELASNTN